MPWCRGLWVRVARKACWFVYCKIQLEIVGHPGIFGILHLTYYVLYACCSVCSLQVMTSSNHPNQLTVMTSLNLCGRLIFSDGFNMNIKYFYIYLLYFAAWELNRSSISDALSLERSVRAEETQVDAAVWCWVMRNEAECAHSENTDEGSASLFHSFIHHSEMLSDKCEREMIWKPSESQTSAQLQEANTPSQCVCVCVSVCSHQYSDLFLTFIKTHENQGGRSISRCAPRWLSWLTNTKYRNIFRRKSDGAHRASRRCTAGAFCVALMLNHHFSPTGRKKITMHKQKQEQAAETWRQVSVRLWILQQQHKLTGSRTWCFRDESLTSPCSLSTVLHEASGRPGDLSTGHMMSDIHSVWSIMRRSRGQTQKTNVFLSVCFTSWIVRIKPFLTFDSSVDLQPEVTEFASMHLYVGGVMMKLQESTLPPPPPLSLSHINPASFVCWQFSPGDLSSGDWFLSAPSSVS